MCKLIKVTLEKRDRKRIRLKVSKRALLVQIQKPIAMIEQEKVPILILPNCGKYQSDQKMYVLKAPKVMQKNSRNNTQVIFLSFFQSNSPEY